MNRSTFGRNCDQSPLLVSSSKYLLVLSCLTFVAISGCSSDAVPVADSVIRGGTIATVNPDQPYVEAIAIRGDTIMALGTAAEMEVFIGTNTLITELAGDQLAVPGLIEGHGHYMGIGNAKMILDLTVAKTWDDIVEMVNDAVSRAKPGEWIRGRGWHQEKWETVPEGAIDGNPTHQSLSAVSPENPVYLTHASGHAGFVNEEAMRLGGISSETPNPDGGEIVRDARGEAIGLLRETAQRLVGSALSESRQGLTDEERDAESREMARLAAEEVLSKGITSFHDAGSSFNRIDFFRTLADEGLLPVRLYVMIRASVENLRENLESAYSIGYGDNHLTVRSIKQSIDGALGPHGAWLLEPYYDLPESAGLNTTAVEDVMAAAEIAAEFNFQHNVHAIGDRANRVVLDIFDRAFSTWPENSDRRWRIEHSQHLHPDDIPRFGALGVIASMQGIHATSDAPWVYKRLGPTRAETGAYMWQKLWQTGAVVTNGTDAPVEDVDPIASYYATVSRKLSDGSVFFSDERLTREQALQSYTLNNAFAAFEEDLKGSLEVGKLADITILSKNILDVPEEEILDTRVLYTIVGGEILFRADSTSSSSTE